MISCYIYGRGKDGYMNYNPSYSKIDEEHYFLQMAQYPVCNNMNHQDQPQKIFFYQAQSKENGLCTIVGQTSFVKINTSIVSGGRDTVFSFQYLLNGKEQKALFENPADLEKFYPFPVKMDQMYSVKGGELDLTLHNAVFDPDEYIRKKEQNTETLSLYSVHDLLQAFGLTEEKLEQFLYTLFLFNTQEKVYLMLPENTKECTNMAFELMRRVLSILPEALVRYNGFVTYVNKAKPQEADYVPYEIRYIFLANTAENDDLCKNTRDAYVFYKNCISGIEIPDNFRKIINDMKTALLGGGRSQELELLWLYIDNYLRRDMSFPVSLTEYDALYSLAKICTKLDSCSEKVSCKELWDNLDTLWRMIEERTQLWDSRLKNDIIRYMQTVIDGDLVDETDEYRRLFIYYDKIPEIKPCIEEFFYRKVNDYRLLEKYMKILESCSDLKKKVYNHSLDMLTNLLDTGMLEESLYETVLALYEENNSLQDKIQSFFERKIENEQELEKYEFLIDSKNHELWLEIEKRLYVNPSKLDFLLDAEIDYLRCIFEEQKAVPKAAMDDFWKTIMHLHKLNRMILNTHRYCSAVESQITSLLSGWIAPMAMKGILAESYRQIKQLNLPQTYLDLFKNISYEYLGKNAARICIECQDEEILQKWPYVSEDDVDYQKIKKQLTGKRMLEQYTEEFESTINEKDILGIAKMFKEKREVVDAVRDSEKLDDYLRSIFSKLEKGVCAPKKDKTARDYYDALCLELLCAYPEKMEKLFDYIMRSQYGGVAAMGSIHRSLKSARMSYIINMNDMAVIKEQMAAAIKKYFKNYKISRQDKKAIKSENDFLVSIGINPLSLLRRG